MSAPTISPRLPSESAEVRGDGALVRVLALFLLAKVVLLVVGGQRVRFVMDEMAFLAQFMDFRDGLYSVVDPIKTVFAAYLFALPRLFSNESVILLLGARGIGTILGLAIAGLVWRASRELGSDRLLAMLATAALFSFTAFAEQGFRIRSDLVSAFFAVVGLAVAVSALGSQRRAWWVGVAAGCAFVSTQKAVYVLAAFLLATLVAGSKGPLSERLGLAARLFCGWGAVLLTYAIWFGGLAFPSVIEKIFLSPRQVAFKDVSAYPDIGRYVVQTLARNVIPWSLALIGLALVVREWPKRTPEERWAAVASVGIVTLVFLHNQPWPYIFVLAVPFAAIWVPFAVRALAPNDPRRRFELAAAATLLLAFSFPRNVRYVAVHTNAEQLAVVREAEAFVAPGERYFDAIGMLPARRLALNFPDGWWDAPKIGRLRRRLATGDASEFARLIEGRPKLWILNYRFGPLWPQIKAILRDAYVRVGEATVLAGTVVEEDGGKTVFECRWPGRYRLFSLSGRPLEELFSIDDGEAATELEIAVGRHQVRRSSAGPPAVLLPAETRADSASFGVRALEDPSPDLFAGVYDY